MIPSTYPAGYSITATTGYTGTHSRTKLPYNPDWTAPDDAAADADGTASRR